MKKLYRANSSTVGGVCKGLSKYFIVDESLIRIIFFALIFTPFYCSHQEHFVLQHKITTAQNAAQYYSIGPLRGHFYCFN